MIGLIGLPSQSMICNSVEVPVEMNLPLIVTECVNGHVLDVSSEVVKPIMQVHQINLYPIGAHQLPVGTFSLTTLFSPNLPLKLYSCIFITGY